MLDAPDDELTDWATAKMKDRMEKSANWKVLGILKDKVYEVHDKKNSMLLIW